MDKQNPEELARDALDRAKEDLRSRLGIYPADVSGAAKVAALDSTRNVLVEPPGKKHWSFKELADRTGVNIQDLEKLAGQQGAVEQILNVFAPLISGDSTKDSQLTAEVWNFLNEVKEKSGGQILDENGVRALRAFWNELVNKTRVSEVDESLSQSLSPLRSIVQDNPTRREQ